MMASCEITEDYYALLGVSQTATLEMIGTIIEGWQ